MDQPPKYVTDKIDLAKKSAEKTASFDLEKEKNLGLAIEELALKFALEDFDNNPVYEYARQKRRAELKKEIRDFVENGGYRAMLLELPKDKIVSTLKKLWEQKLERETSRKDQAA